MSEIIKRIMHPFTYKHPTFNVKGLDTGMTPREFAHYLRKQLRKAGEHLHHHTAQSAAIWWYAQSEECKIARKLAAVCALELAAYSDEECLLFVWKSKRISYVEIGELAHALGCRAGRGAVTLEEALDVYDKIK